MEHKHNEEYTSVPQDVVVQVDKASDTTTNSPRLLSCPPPVPDVFQWKFLLSWRFLNPFAWFVLFCVGGPLMVYLLNYNIVNSGYVDYFNYGINVSGSAPVACDVQKTWSSWVTIFQINIRTGYISFTTAKICDVAFDLVVGRMGQAILTWMSYRVYADVFIYLAERQAVPYKIFFATTTRPTSLSSVGSYIKAIFSKKGIQIALLWTLVTVSYCLVYPTLISASTSLVGATVSAVSLPSGGTATVVDYANSAAYRLTNSNLTDKPDPWFVYTRDVNKIPPKADNIMYINGKDWGGSGSDEKFEVNRTMYIISNTTTIDAGFHYGGDFFQIDPARNKGGDSLWHNQTICMPDSNHYQWGASYELLVIIVICQILWSTAMLVVWTYACGNSATLLSGRKMGLFTAMLLLSEPLRKELDDESDAARKLPTKGKLHSEKNLRGIANTMDPVMYENSILKRVGRKGRQDDKR
ncbi:hypothetical protein LTR84_011139 [Exophiala bonariae]|uniref:Uncharacterized protein n=1 Tax=Exophiala bonariae TaxID=1690606 RepID=A0AAV9NJX1_9EURO|nr:hypothetical protein LTR84_011139 [Exophiala bonariae]